MVRSDIVIVLICVGHVIVTQRGFWMDVYVPGYGRIFVGRGLLTLRLFGFSIFIIVVVMLLLVGDLSRLKRN